MSIGDVVEMVAYLMAAWVLGFCAGYALTKFRDAVNQTM